jgi:hypothetical protein
MSEWEPEEFAVGDRVINPSHPDWGVGAVADALRMGEELADGVVLMTQQKKAGQCLAVRFDDGRTRIIISSSTRLKRAR